MKLAKPNLPTIVQVVGYYPPHLGGSEVVAQKISEILASLNYPVKVLTSSIGQDPKQSGKEKIGSLQIFRLKAFEIAHTPIAPGLLWQLLRLPKRSIIHLHLAQAFYPELVWLTSKLRGIPYVVHFHLDLMPSGSLGKLFLVYKKFVLSKVIKDAAKVIVFSKQQRAFVIEKYQLVPEQVQVIPNGVSEDYLNLYRPRKKLHNKIRLLFVGRLSFQKRVDRLIRALDELKYPYQLDIVGDGEERQGLEALVRYLQLKHVKFHGSKHGKALKRFYKRADVFILPSDSEGMPITLLESMATGLPIIGSEVPGITEHLKDIGTTVPNPSPQNFTVAINDFIENYKERSLEPLSRASHEFAKQLSWPNQVNKLKAMYQRLQAKPDPIPDKNKSTKQLVKLGFYVGLLAWWVIYILARSSSSLSAVVVNSLGFSFLMIVPGFLTLIGLRIKSLPAWGKLVLTVGLSLLELMLVGLIGNTVLQWFGVLRPLQTNYLIDEISLLLAVLAIFSWRRLSIDIKAAGSKLKKLFGDRLNLILVLTPLSFVALAVMGATALNNGVGEPWTFIMIWAIAGYSTALVYLSKRLNDSVICWGMFLSALSLLLMTSLRSWYISGHDIQQEFKVFELAKNNGVWQIQKFRDPYNACLSITLLPTMLFNLLKSSDTYIFKLYYQIIFALCPIVIYLFMRRWVSRALAFVSVIYFIAFPTFFTDMPSLNRQELGFLFFSLLLYIVFSSGIKKSLQKGLFLALAVGLVLSHYSTTYSAIAIFGVALIARPVILFIVRRLKRWRPFKNTSLPLLVKKADRDQPQLSVSLVAGIVFLSFSWTTLTNTGNGALQVAKSTFAAVTKQFSVLESRSTDTGYSLISLGNKSNADEVKNFKSKVVQPARAKQPNDFYPQSAPELSNITPLANSTLGLTILGRGLQNIGLNVQAFNGAFRQATAKLLQIFVLIGLAYVIFRKQRDKLLNAEFFALAVASIIFVFLQVILPVVSIDYGILRAFQQTLMILSIFIVIGSLLISRLIPGKLFSRSLPVIIAMIFFLSTTGFFTQLVGGYTGQLNFNNSGLDYELYYTHKTELLGYQWLKTNGGLNTPDRIQSFIQADHYNLIKFPDIVGYDNSNDIYPGLIRKDSYVFMGYTNVHDDKASLLYNGDIIQYQYPMQILNQNKNLLYSNGDVNIYK